PRGEDPEHSRPASEIRKRTTRRQLQQPLQACPRGRVGPPTERSALAEDDVDQAWLRYRRPRGPHDHPPTDHVGPVVREAPLWPIVGDLGLGQLVGPTT